jgi:Fur family transcriptional regulator, ferric uptake regulator
MNAGRRYYDTRQRRAILRALAKAPGFVSARTLHARLRQAGHPVALTTVYRALNAYAETGRVATTHNPGGEQLFHLATDPQHSHYLVCRTCGDSVPVDADTVEHWAAATATEHEFTDVHPVIELTGRCPACDHSGRGDARPSR